MKQIGKLSPEERTALTAELAEIGPWKLAGTHGVLRAERGGFPRHEQAAVTADALIEAVKDSIYDGKRQREAVGDKFID